MPFWNASIAEMSTQLWQPLESELHEDNSDLPGLRKKSEGRGKASWSTTRIRKSKTATVQTFTYKVNEQIERPLKKKKVRKKNEKETDAQDLLTRKVKLLPNEEQRVCLKKLFGAARFVYNKAIKHIHDLRKPGIVSSKVTSDVNVKPDDEDEVKVTDGINSIKPEGINLNNMRKLYTHNVAYESQDTWMKSVPYDIRDGALQDALQAYTNGKKLWKEKKLPYQLKFRSKKAPSESIYICSRAVKVNEIVLNTTS